MMIKLVIIGAVLLGGGIIFVSETNQLLPEFFKNIFDSTKKDLNQMKDNTIQTTETIGTGMKTVSDDINDFAESSAEQLSEGINDLGESTLQVIPFGGILGDSQKANSESSDSQKANSESSERHATTSTEGHTTESTSKTNPTSFSDSSPTTIVTKTRTTQTFETLSLKTTQQLDDTVMLHYEDTSGKTMSVTVILRTTEKDLFVGTFYSSMFEASVNDATKTSYFIDMIVEHEEYGTIVSSVFNPVDTPDTIINGVFSQS